MEESQLICQDFCPNLQRVSEVREKKLSEDVIQSLADIFQVLSTPTRIKIINALASRELCVCDISELLEMSQSAISHQLRILRNHNLVKNYKKGRSVYYSLDDNHILQLFCQGLAHVMEEK